MYRLLITFNTSGRTKAWPIPYADLYMAMAMAEKIAGRPVVYRVAVDHGSRKVFTISSKQGRTTYE